MYRFQWGYLFRDTIDDITNGVGPNHKCKCWKQPWLDKVCFYEIVVVTRGVWCQMISYLNWIVKCNWWLDPGRGLGSRNNTGTFNSPLLPRTVPQFWQRYSDQSAFILSVFICVAKRGRVISLHSWENHPTPIRCTDKYWQNNCCEYMIFREGSNQCLLLVSSSDLHFHTLRIY